MIDAIFKYLVPQKAIDYILKARDFLKGKKTYIAAAILLLQALLAYLDQLTGLGGVTQLVEWVKNLAANEATLHLAEALALFGIRSAIAKK